MGGASLTSPEVCLRAYAHSVVLTVDGPGSGSGPLQCLKHLVETEGWRGLARGTTGTLAREVPGNALFFTVYEVFCNLGIELSRPWLGSIHHPAKEPVIY